VVYEQRPSPFVARYGWYHYKKINIDRLRAALAQFIGTHDFRAFCTIENVIIENTVRTIDTIDVLYDTELCAYRIEIKGEKFLRYMIRRMIGAAVKVACDDTISIDIICRTLEKKDPSHSLPNAPACGLTLMKIEYDFIRSNPSHAQDER
jgi:tRNA pseudouridine38-40 synthase